MISKVIIIDHTLISKHILYPFLNELEQINSAVIIKINNPCTIELIQRRNMSQDFNYDFTSMNISDDIKILLWAISIKELEPQIVKKDEKFSDIFFLKRSTLFLITLLI